MTEACAPAIRYRLAQLNPCRLRERDTREPRGPGLRVCVSRGLRGGYRLLHVAMMSKVRTNLLHEPWLTGLTLLVFEDHMLASGVGRCVAPVAAKVSFVASRSTYTPATVCLVSACAGHVRDSLCL